MNVILHTVILSVFFTSCKASFTGSSKQRGPEAVTKPTPTPSSVDPKNPKPTPNNDPVNPVTNFSMLTMTYSTSDSKFEQLQIKLKGSPKDWQDVSWSVGGEVYIPNLCDADHVSNISIQGKHNGCAFVVGSTPDTAISNKDLNLVSFDLSSTCNSMQNPTTTVLKCNGPGLKLVAP